MCDDVIISRACARPRWHRARVDGVVMMDDGDGRDGPGGGLQV